MMLRVKSALILACCLWPISASALLAACTVTATGITFPPYAYSDRSDASGLGDVAVTCTAVLVVGLGTYSIALSPGNGSYASRVLLSGPQALNYNVYANSARQQVWGDGSGGTQPVTDSYLFLLTPSVRHYTAYGLLPAGQNKPAGTYTDSVTVTLTF